MRALNFRGVVVALTGWWCALLLSAAPAPREMPDYSDPANLPPPPADAIGFPSRDPGLDALPGFQNPPPGYGEVPFWWWTGDPLDKDRLLWQIEELHRKGVSGMQVNYAHEDTSGWPTYAAEPEIFSKEWWDIWKFVARECGKRSMGIGLSGYTLDWPNGRSLVSRTIYSEEEIQGRELEVAQKTRASGGETVVLELPDEIIGVRAHPLEGGLLAPGGKDLTGFIRGRRLEWAAPEGDWIIWVYRTHRKPGTLNPIHPLAGWRVIEKFFQPFQDHAPGQSAVGLNYFFHDELQFGVGDRIWCDDFARVFRELKGYDVFDALPALFTDIGPTTPKARLDFMEVKTRLAQERYFIPIFQWHWSRGKIYGCDQGSRGKDPLEFGDYFSAVRWYTAPGHDTPGGNADLIKGKVSSSIAHLYRRPRVWLEGYHSLGWGATPERLMFATRENFLYGCTLLNLHGLYYTTHGGYWEWAPPCYHFRMPYWEHMDTFLKYFERLSYLLSQGVHQSEVAVLYPVTPGQAGMGGREATGLAFGAGSRLFQNGRDFIFIDDESLARAEAREGRLRVADASHRLLVLPGMRAVRWSTIQKARELFHAGGMVIALAALPEASDRAGRNDPELNKVVAEVFGATAAEVEAGARPPIRRSAAGGTAAVILESTSPAIRLYDGGFTGRWAWSREVTNRVYFKAVWHNPSGSTQSVPAKFFCDNAGVLYVNGNKICEGVDYQTGWTGSIPLKDGDVITIDALDHDAPSRRGSAGLFLALVRDGKTVLSTEHLRYTLVQPFGQGWRTNSNLAGLSAPDPTNVHELHKGKSGGGLWAGFDEVAGAIPPTVEASSPVRALHRKIGPRDVYLVMGAPKGSEGFFRAKGKVELWDPWTGQTAPLHVASASPEGTRVRLPLEPYEAQLIVFTPGATAPAVTATDLDEVTDLRNAGGTLGVRGYAAQPGDKTATVQLDGRTRELRGTAAAAPAALVLDGEWEFELRPTLDNRWGDFRLPATEKQIGAEARIFRYAEETSPDPGWQAPAFDDSRWARVTHGFGPKFWKLGPLPAASDANALDSQLAAMKTVDASQPVRIGGVSYQWQPYEFSWRWGREGDPGHQGYHGLKENVTDDFICLGKPRDGHNETVYGPEGEGGRYYLWTAAHSQTESAAKAAVGGLKPAAVYLNGTQVSSLGDEVRLRSGANPLLLRYDSHGRGHFVLLRTGTTEAGVRAPLSMKWYDRPGLVPFDVQPATTRPAGWYRFVAPPGLRSLTVGVRGAVQVWADGRACPVASLSADERGVSRYTVRLPEPIVGRAAVALRIEPQRGFYGGSALPEPIQLECGRGRMPLGDWSQGTALECYSGGAWYRKSISLSPEQARSRVRLHLGEVVATAEVRINGRTAGVRVAPPWTVDLSDWVKPGENRLEILVYNTLANHYLTIPTRYRGSLKSGLIGPVRMEFQSPVELTE